jgi:RHS repeat-associated protein
LLGNGTACLVWSSPLPGYTGRHMRYVDLIGGQKPHLLIKVVNNLGAETRVHYSPSTRFYVDDKLAGKPWITRLPFPVHVVERVETYDHISRNRFVTRYAYHHGYFDGEEREFRGFGMVEQFDTEEFAALSASGDLPIGDNIDTASHVPPVHTRTWFHTGVYLNREHISRQFEGEYYREPGLNNQEFRALLLPDTILPASDPQAEERESCRALKGMMLRQEVYADDAPPGSSAAIIQRARIPYTVIEQNFTIRVLQPRVGNRHAVFFTHPREAITYHYERRLVPTLNGQIIDEVAAASNPNTQWLPDPRMQHTLTLEVDIYGNVLQSAEIGYGRRLDAPGQTRLPQDRDRQRLIHITYTENRVTNAIDDVNQYPDDYRTPLLAETRTYELRKPQQERSSSGLTACFRFEDILTYAIQASDGQHNVDYEDRLFAKALQAVTHNPNEHEKYFRRLIEHIRTLYRPDDMGKTQNDSLALLPLDHLEPLALPGESYKLAFTPGLLAQVYQRPRNGQAPENLLPNAASVLSGQAGDQGGYLMSRDLKTAGAFPNTDPDDHWWIPAGRVFHSPITSDNAAQELAYARQHFFLPRRYRDPFGQTTAVMYDVYALLMVDTCDPLGNRITVGERDAAGNVTCPGNDYRVLQPRLVTDPNRNRAQATFDALGMVVGTAVQGKDNTTGDTLSGFEPDLIQAQVDEFYDVADPHVPVPSLLKGATTRIVYDLDRFRRTQQAHPEDPTQWLPVYAATLARETHVSDPLSPQALKIQISFSYSDGFGREIQKKIQAEPGPLVEGGPVVSPRWVGSGWNIFNNKGKPVRQYEPFFSQLSEKRHQFEFGTQVGVSPILFYDPVERVMATLHPNHTYGKVVFDPWQQTTYDVNDTVAANGTETGDPRTDVDIQGYVGEYFKTQPTTWQTWHQQRIAGVKGAQEQSTAEKTAKHANTPTTAYFDTLGRPFLTIAHNRFDRNNVVVDAKYPTRVVLDIEGNQREVRDAIEQNDDPQGRIVMRYDYDLLGNRIRQASMEAGERWMLNDVAGKPIRVWDSRGHVFRIEYDPLRRPLRSFVTGADLANPNQELLTERLVYGEQHPEDELRNLRGKLYLHLDQAGMVTNEAHDFKGNLLRTSRRLAREYKQAINWNAVNAVLPANSTTKFNPAALEVALAPRLEADTFASCTSYDARNRPVQLIVLRSDQPGAKHNVIQPVYNETNLLERVHVWLDHPTEPTGLLHPATVPPAPVGVNNIDYDAKGQRLRIEYKNGASTRYAYDPETFRLIHLYTRRGAAFSEDCGGDPTPRFAAPDVPPPNTPCGLQNLHYTYDPAGNITYIRDDAQQAVYFGGQVVPPHCDYTYDAISRLIGATGREHIGQGGQPETTWNDAFHVRLPHPGDGQAVRNYAEFYEYDAVGNFEKLIHQAANGSWTRSYAYNEASLIEPTKQSNRLSSTTVGSGPPETYPYDTHGNMMRLNHLPLMQWDYHDQLQTTVQQVINNGTPETTWYVYDASGQRVRKVTELATGQVKDERIYLGSFEVYRRQGVNAVVRETLHIMDDKQRIVLVETLVQGNEPGVPRQLIRYQFGNHLGSASLELDHQAQIISYEEYYPYGSTSYQAVRSQTEVPKRYRYTGKERDEETGLLYCRARYLAAWLGRWTSSDPQGLIDGLTLYSYARDNPVSAIDPNGTQTYYTPDPATLRNLLQQLVEFTSSTGHEHGIYQEPHGTRLSLVEGTSTGLPPRGENVALAHSHVADPTSTPSNFDLNTVRGQVQQYRRGSPRYHAIHKEQIGARGGDRTFLEASKRGNRIRSVTFDPEGGVTVREFRPAPEAHGEWVPEGPRRPLGKVAGGIERAKAVLKSPVGEFAAQSGGGRGTALLTATKRAAETGTKGLLAGLGVIGAGLGGYKVGTGIDELVQGKTAEGAINVSEGSAELGLSIGTAIAVKKGVLIAEGGITAGGTAVAAGLAAGFSVLLAAESARAAVRGEETPIDVMDKAYGTHFGDIAGWVSGKYSQESASPGFVATLKKAWVVFTN